MDIVCRSELTSLESLEEKSRRIAPLLPSAVAIGLFGPLGAGKTELVRGILRGLGVAGAVPSPSFVLECEYELAAEKHPRARKAHHWDLYRLRGEAVPEELIELLESSSKLIFVEWPEAIEEYLGVKIALDFCPDADSDDETNACARSLEIALMPSRCDSFFNASILEDAVRHLSDGDGGLNFEQFCVLLEKAKLV